MEDEDGIWWRSEGRGCGRSDVISVVEVTTLDALDSALYVALRGCAESLRASSLSGDASAWWSWSL